jgi:hypothetical protein
MRSARSTAKKGNRNAVARRILLAAIPSVLFYGCAAVSEPGCAKHHCDPSIDEQFKRNASWDARSPDEYAKLPAEH